MALNSSFDMSTAHAADAFCEHILNLEVEPG
jgi:hypothetical protein